MRSYSQGTSLIEVVLVIAVTATLMSLTIPVVVKLLRTSRDVQEDLALTRSLDALQDQLADDLGEYRIEGTSIPRNELVLGAPPLRIVSLQRPQEWIEYHRTQDGLDRGFRGSSAQSSTELFWLPKLTRVHWRHEPPPSNSLTMTIQVPWREKLAFRTRPRTFRVRVTTEQEP